MTTALALILLITIPSLPQNKSTQTFASFWLQFKTAVAKNDKEAVANMTKFPIYIGDELTRDQFIKKYSQIFDRRVRRCFVRAKPEHDYQEYLKTVKLTKKYKAPPPQPIEDNGSYSVFCGEEIFSFEVVDGKYKFTGIGVND